MKIIKITLLVIISLILISVLVLRVIKVRNDESTVTILSGLEEGDKFLTATYYPISDKININDSITFYPGKLLVQDKIKLKHRFLIFSSYFEKAPRNGKNLIYQAIGNSNNFKLVIHANRNDTSLHHISYTKGKEWLNSYSLDNTVLDAKNKEYEIEDYKRLDTLKFYIKQTQIQSADIGEYYANEITLLKEPLDSILFVRK